MSEVTAIAEGGYHTVALKSGDPLAITTQPTALAVNVTSNAMFSVTATGTDPLAYQWRKDGADIASATTATLNLVNVQTNQAGGYSVVITNDYGSITSSVVALTVNPLSQTITFGTLGNTIASAPPFTVSATSSSGLAVNFGIVSGPATLSGSTLTLTGPGTVTVRAFQAGNVTFSAATPVDRSFTVSGAPPGISTQPTALAVNVTSNATFTVAATGTPPLAYQWFGLTPLLSGATGTAQVAGGFVFGAQVVSGGAGYSQAPAVRFIGGGGSGATASATVDNGAVVGITVINSGSGYSSPPSLLIDPPNGFLAGQTNAVLTLNNVSANDAGSYLVVITNLYGSVTSSAAALTVNVPVTITQQPQSIVTGLGSNAVFTVSASGTAPLTYRWYWQPGNSRTALAVPDVRNGFVVGAAVLSGGGFYPSIPAVQILAGAGSGVTATATVNNGVVTAVNILSAGSGYPSNAVIQIDPPVAGTTQLLSGQTATNLSLPGLGALASGSYFVVVTNAGGSVTSNPAMLRVLVPQRFVQPPQRLGDGAFRLLFGAHDGGFLLTNDLASLEVWGSTNVANTNAWVRITNGITVQNGQVQVDDTDSPSLPRRFYRVITR